MNSNNIRHSQFELFPGNEVKVPESKKNYYLFRGLTMSLENIIVFCIISVMISVLVFSIGVEKGKKLSGLSKTEPIYTILWLLPCEYVKMILCCC